jgi:hypothetical protein
LFLILATAATGAQTNPTSSLGLVVHVCAETDVDDATLRRAATVAERLMTSAGAIATWRICKRNERSDGWNDVAPHIVAILLSRRLGKEPDKCGVADRGTRSVGTALLSVPCLEEFTRRIARMSGYRSHPQLASGRYDDFLGVLVAHEIGHLLGLGHARTGVMRSRLNVDDLVAFRADTLRFTPKEAARLRASSAQVRSTLAQQ